MEIHTAAPLVPERSTFDVEHAIAKLKNYKLPVIDHIPSEPIKTKGESLRSEIHKLTNSIWIRQNFLSSRRVHYYTNLQEGPSK
jgi:hypothetical protein